MTRGDISMKQGHQPHFEISGVIGLSGKAIGVVVLSVSRKVAFSITEKMLGERPTAIDADVTDAAVCASAVGAVVREFGGVDTLVNLAQQFRPARPVAEVTEEDMHICFESGPLASLRMMQLCHPHMKARR